MVREIVRGTRVLTFFNTLTTTIMPKKNLAHEIIKAFIRAQRDSGNTNTSSKIAQEIAIEFGEDESRVRKIIVSYAQRSAKKPAKTFSIGENCFIYKNGREVNNCRELTNGPRRNQPWLEIERECLVCSLSHHRDGDAIEMVCDELAEYFDREASALVAEYYRIRRIKK